MFNLKINEFHKKVKWRKYLLKLSSQSLSGTNWPNMIRFFSNIITGNVIVFHGNLIIQIKLLNAGPTYFKSRIFCNQTFTILLDFGNKKVITAKLEKVF